ncbi:hypothetical protein FV139_20590 [Parahaliea maris]|uniref:Uncharacterized protein n=1 Tax=Parahaliea maris TaxID=2716870 RepID=A0A5C8ZN65_9GAMM|nr:hypothetical protein [Parahaliea maris]TXS89079.1 hypothetical protein FV139_20590 [Parahaliea maris]
MTWTVKTDLGFWRNFKICVDGTNYFLAWSRAGRRFAVNHDLRRLQRDHAAILAQLGKRLLADPDAPVGPDYKPDPRPRRPKRIRKPRTRPDASVDAAEELYL